MESKANKFCFMETQLTQPIFLVEETGLVSINSFQHFRLFVYVSTL